MPRLDLRLIAVAKRIRSAVHADIGSDHGNLLVALLQGGHIGRGLAVENKRQPFLNSQLALTGLNAEVRFGDGLGVIDKNEADSLSICGMGGQKMVAILSAHPDRIPPKFVLQPNRRPELIRRWAFEHGFHLTDETIAQGHWPYQIMSFQHGDAEADPAYRDVDFEAAILFGPLLLKQRDPDLLHQLETEFEYLSQFGRLNADGSTRLGLITRLLRSG